MDRHALLYTGPAAAVTPPTRRRVRALCCCLTVVYAFVHAPAAGAQVAPAAGAQVASAVAAPGGAAAEERAIRAVLARFYAGWNAHDADQMVSAYADDVDHVNVYAEWHQGKAAIREDLRQLHAGPGKNSQKTYTVEKVRFVRSDVAVVHVRSLSAVGNLGTYVMMKESGAWRTVSFTNVGYELTPTGPRTGVTRKPGAPDPPTAVPASTQAPTGVHPATGSPGGAHVVRP